MKIRNLNILKCPYCGGDLEVAETKDRDEEYIINGIIKCKCSEYPVLEGILNLQLNANNGYLVDLIKNGREKDALILSLWRFSNYFSFKISFTENDVLRSLLLRSIQELANYGCKNYFKDKTFFESLGQGGFENYLKHRFSTETFWPVYSFIPLLKNKEIILDLCCGTGHISYIISDYIKPKNHFCIDYSFANLYYVKKYFSRDSQCICMDANYTLPFKDNVLDAVVLLDAYHYIKARAYLAKELMRILQLDGVLIASHLHNSLKINFSPGMALSPSDWIGLFDGFPVNAMSEKELYESFFIKNTLDLTKNSSVDDLNNSNSITVFGSYNRQFFKYYKNIDQDFLYTKNNLIINPIYKKQYDKNQIKLKLNFPEFFKKEYPFAVEYMKNEYILPKNLLEKIKEKDYISDQTSVEYLMKHFILLNVPYRYY